MGFPLAPPNRWSSSGKWQLFIPWRWENHPLNHLAPGDFLVSGISSMKFSTKKISSWLQLHVSNNANNVRLQNGNITDWFDSRPWTWPFSAIFCAWQRSWLSPDPFVQRFAPLFRVNGVNGSPLNEAMSPKKLGAPMMVFCSYPEEFERMRGDL